jgi:hypothetical protein
MGEKPPSPWIRWLVFPMVGAWCGLLITAPLAAFSEPWGWVGATFGLISGVLIAWRNPQILLDRPDLSMKKRREPTANAKIVLAFLSMICASCIVYASRSDNSDKGILFVIAMLLLISMSRRLLRGAFGTLGSAAGMLLCGALLFAFIRSILGPTSKNLGALVPLTTLMVVFEAYDEWRALQRAERRRNSRN